MYSDLSDELFRKLLRAMLTGESYVSPEEDDPDGPEDPFEQEPDEEEDDPEFAEGED